MMLQPIELLRKELTSLKYIASFKERNNIEAKENELIPDYENAIKFLDKINNIDAANHKTTLLTLSTKKYD